MIDLLKSLHSVAWGSVSSLLEKRPSTGYLFSIATTGAGLAGILDLATKIVGLVSVCIGLVVGLYTLRIQKRAWDRGNEEKK